MGTLMSRAGFAQSQATPWMIATETLQLLNSGPALPAFLQKSAQRGSEPNFVYGVLHESRQLNERGLPPEPYLLKANEGLAKGISPSQIRPALEGTRRQTEQAEVLVNEAQFRGLVFSNPQQRRLAIQEYQWGLRGFSAPPFRSGVPPPGLMKEGKDKKSPGPGWGTGWEGKAPGKGPRYDKNNNDYDKIDPKGPHGADQGKNAPGKNKSKRK